MAKKRSQFTDEQLTSPLEPPSLIKKVGSGVVSGLSAVGNILDLPGSSVRDVLAGRNPIDQWASPTSSLNRTSGRDLLRQHGLAGHKDTYGNFFGGLAAEVALDPLLPFTGGAKAVGAMGANMAKAGIHGLEAARIATAAAKAGKLAGVGARWVGPREARFLLTPQHVKDFAPAQFKMLEDVARWGGQQLDMGEQMGGLFKFWPTGSLVGTGETARKVARGMDVAGDVLRHGKIPGTSIRPVGDLANLLNKKAGNAVNAEDLQTAYHQFHAREGIRAHTKSFGYRLVNGLREAGHATADVMQVADWFELPHTAPKELQPLIAETHQFLEQIPKLADELGVKLPNLNVLTQAAGGRSKYFPGFLAEGLEQAKSGRAPRFDPLAPSSQHRMAWRAGIKDAPSAIGTASERGVRHITSDIFKDKTLGSIADAIKAAPVGPQRKQLRKLGEQYLEHAFGQVLPQEHLTHKQAGLLAKHNLPPSLQAAQVLSQLKPGLAKKLRPKSTHKAVLREMMKLSPEARKAGVYANHPLVDFIAGTVGSMEKLTTTRVALERMRDAAVPKATAGSVPIKSILKELDLDAGKALTWLSNNGLAGADQMSIPADTAKFLTQKHELADGGPSAMKAWLSAYDIFARITKHVYTNLRPSFNPRNVASGQFSNALVGQLTGEGIAGANSIVRGGEVAGLKDIPFFQEEAAKRGIQGLTDQQATDMFRELLAGAETTGSYGVSQHQPHGQVGGTIDDLIRDMPGGQPFRWKQVGEKVLGQHGTSWNPLNWKIAGVGGAQKTTIPLGAAGEDFSYWAESLNRIAPMIALMKDGVHPQEAIQRVLQAQVGYQSRFYTDFENQVMKRLALFYSFSKGMLPFTLQQLIENPGGRLAQTLRSINQTKDEDELVPNYIAETASIPVGNIPGMQPLEPGAKRYITGLGLGFEDPAQMAVPSLQNFGLEMLSRANPLIKGPLESITGQTFFQRSPAGGGRSIEDLDPALGRTLSNLGQMTGLREKNTPIRFPGSNVIEHMLSNSPLSTLLTTARTATDPRKGVGAKVTNLLTGVRVSDVSPAAQDRELLNRAGAIEKQLLGAREYRTSYIPADKKEEFTPQQQELANELRTLRKLLEQRKESRSNKK